jgi:truncated hemoglobin YjbI
MKNKLKTLNFKMSKEEAEYLYELMSDRFDSTVSGEPEEDFLMKLADRLSSAVINMEATI